jgi:hypothetical protein
MNKALVKLKHPVIEAAAPGGPAFFADRLAGFDLLVQDSVKQYGFC